MSKPGSLRMGPPFSEFFASGRTGGGVVSAYRAHWAWMAGDSDACREASAFLKLSARRDSWPSLSSEDRQLLRNLLLWRALWDHSARSLILRLESELWVRASDECAGHRAERRMLELFLAEIDPAAGPVERGRLPELLLEDPEGRDSVGCLRPLIEIFLSGSPEAAPEDLRDFAACLLSAKDRRPPPKHPGLWVDASGYRLSRAGTTWVSEPMARAFQFLASAHVADAEAFLGAAFGIYRYRPEIHNPKIFNLLVRMRQKAPKELQLQFRSGKVYALGDWNRVEFWCENPLTLELMGDVDWRELLEEWSMARSLKTMRKAKVPLMEIRQKLATRPVWSRRDLEAVLGSSRSTTARILAALVKQGVLRKEGRGRSIRYHFRKRAH